MDNINQFIDTKTTFTKLSSLKKRNSFFSLLFCVVFTTIFDFNPFGINNFFSDLFISLYSHDGVEEVEKDAEEDCESYTELVNTPGVEQSTQESTREQASTEICDNGLDDDGDGYIDAFDSDCSCACPAGGTVISSIPSGYTIPAGETHCLNADVTISSSSHNFTVNGDLYILAGATLEVPSGAGMTVGSSGNILVCEDAGYYYYKVTTVVDYDIYNFGWVKICGTEITFNNPIILGRNSLFGVDVTTINWYATIEYNHTGGGNAYMFLDPTSIEPISPGDTVCLNGVPEIIVELDRASDTPSCVTDCDGCPELSTISHTACSDGSIEATYLALQDNLEICGNTLDDNNDGRVDEPYPGGVEANLQLWLKADQGTNTTTNGNDITSWSDQSANGYTASADPNSTDDPVYQSNAINYNPGINFDGEYTDDYSDGLHLGSDYIFAVDSGLHIIAIVGPDIDNETDNYVFDFGLQSNGGYGMIYSNNNYGLYTNSSNGGTNTELTHSEGDTPALIEMEVDFNDYHAFYHNGSTLNSTNISLDYLDASRVNWAPSYYYNSINTSGPVSIGRKSASTFLANDGGRIFDGDISEVLVYTDLLSSSDKQRIYSYLAIKYGISLTHNYYSSAGTILKPASDGFENQIFGIGRDDCSGLNQKQSQSVEEGVLTLSLGSLAADNQANTSTFPQDESFFIVGNDGGAVNTWIPLGDGSMDYRIPRTWKIDKTNFDEDVYYIFDVDDPQANIASLPSNAASDYKIKFDYDGDFTGGAGLSTPLTNTGGSLYEININSGATLYFTIIYTGSGTTPEICNNLVDDDGDGLVDCNDPDCLGTYSLDLTDSVACESSTTLFLDSGTLPAGNFSGPGVAGTNFDASVAGAGVHTISYDFNNPQGCLITLYDSITVHPIPTVSLNLTDTIECENETLSALTGGLPTGGVYSGNGVSGGNFNATAAGLGTHTITYTYTDSNGCTNSAVDNITVISLPTVNLTLVDDSDCVTSTSLILDGGSPAGGTYSGAHVSGNVFDPSSAGAGIHTITYTYTNTSGCTNSTTDQIVVFALPNVSLNLTDNEDCILNNTFPLSEGLPVGGSYAGPGVSGTNFDASTAGLGIHTISYTYTDANGCTNTATDQIEVVSVPTVTLSLPNNEVCIDAANIDLSVGTPSGGTYSGNGVTGTTFSPSAAGVGSHTITYSYTDSNGCGDVATDNINVYGAPVMGFATKANPSICGGTDGSITVNASGGTGSFEYRIDGGVWQTSNVFNGLASGSYLVEVRNDNGYCLASATEDLSDPFNPVADINLSSSQSCIAVAISIDATDAGTGATYSWDFGSGATPATASGMGPHDVTYSTAGSKNIQLTVQKDGCTATDAHSVLINDIPTVSLNLTEDSACESSSILSLSGGNPTGGTFSGAGVSGSNFDASAVGPGNYTITYTYTDANACVNTATDQVTVYPLTTVTLNLPTTEVCITNDNIALSGASPSGGTYSGTGVVGTVFDASLAGVGTHQVTYTFTNTDGCTSTASDFIDVYDLPTINLVDSDNPTTCSGTEGSITISASGGTGSFEYRLNSGAWQTGNVFNGLSSGAYDIFVRNSNGFCEVEHTANPVILTEPPVTIVTTQVISNYTGEQISCVGASDGFAVASATGGTSPYTFSWSNAQSGDTLKNVSAGTYIVTVSDAVGCQGIQTVTLNDPPPLGVTAVFTNPSCYGASDGSIDVTATGGVGAYTYAWEDLGPIAFYPFDNNTLDISGNDHHAVEVWGTEWYSNDAVDGQSFQFQWATGVRLDDGNFLDVPFDQRSVVMNIKATGEFDEKYLLYDEGGLEGGIALGIDNGQLTGAVSNGFFKRSAFSVAIPNDGDWHEVGFVYDRGEFTLYVDGVPGTTLVTGFNIIYINLLGDFNYSGLGAPMGNTAYGFESYNAFEGLMDNVAIYDNPYQGYNTVDVGGDSSGGDRTDIPAGEYQVYVYDLNGCIDSITLTLTQPDSLALSANISDVACRGEANGSIDLQVAGGVAPFSYNWSNSETTEDLSGLGPGNYLVTVIDNNGCEAIERFRVNEPPQLSVTASTSSNFNGFSVSCFGATDGSATATPAGGIPPYNYSWTNGASTNDLNNVGTGTYTVTITDNNGCTAVDSVALNGPAEIVVTTTVTSSFGGEDISCVGASDGQARVSAQFGAAPYSYNWSNGQTGNDLIGVVAGTYGVTVRDNNGCTATSSVVLSDPPPIVLNLNINSDFNGEAISCAGEADGEILANASGGAGTSYSYLWSDGTTNPLLENVPAGTYSVVVTDNFGCSVSESITLTEPDPISSSIAVNSDYNGFAVSCNGGNDGDIETLVSGGVAPFTYTWSNGVTTAANSNVGAGTYFVTVTDANNCTSVSTLTLSNPSNISVDITGNTPSDCSVNDGSIVMNAAGGIGTYEYSLDGINFQSSGTFSGLAPGSYLGYVRNESGTCLTGPQAIIINLPESPTIDNLTIINPTTSSSNDGAILVNASGSGVAIEYSTDGVNWQLSNLFENLDEGNVDIYVRYDGANCISSQSVSLVAGAGVQGSNTSNFCSGDLSGVSFVEVYYLPFREDNILSALRLIYPDSCESNDVVDPVQTYVSIGVVEDQTIITYDHWEDGFETDLSYPTQSTTEVWGDGNPLNGIAPGYTVDELNAADIIVLENLIYSTNRADLPPDYDASDKIGSRGNLSITRLGWASGSENYLAGALEVYPTELWGKDYEIPIGINTDVNEMFEYTAATIMAKDDNTVVQIDTDGNGTNDVTLNLDQGESELIDDLFSGAVITSNQDIQVHLITGNICVNYESRWFTLKPTSLWSDSYLNPVATVNDGTNIHTHYINAPTYVHFYNPNSTTITVNWEDKNGYQGNSVIPPGQTAYVELANEDSGSYFYSTDGSKFYAIATIDSDPGGKRNDWGYALTPLENLSSQITLVGFAPGGVPTIPNSENSSPIWITANHLSGSGGSGNITICIDYDGDGGSLTDLNGTPYDNSVVLSPLDHEKIYDPDGDQTGMRIWVCDGSNAVIAGAWGQAPVDIVEEQYALDLGVGLPNGIPFATSKCVELSRDLNSNGLYDECDEISYSLLVRNTGVLPLSSGSLEIIDTLASDITYIPNSTKLIVNDVVTDISDDGVGSAFPFDESGYNYGSLILPGDSIMFKFEASINSTGAAGIIQNIAYVSNGQSSLTPEVSFPLENPLGPALAGVPADTTVDCSNVPSAPTVGAQVYQVNNCEEMDTILQTLWNVHYVNSENPGNSASLAFDNDPNTYWITETSGGDTHPHEIQIDLGASYFITGFSYLPRQDDSDGRIRDYEVYVSENDSIWGASLSNGLFADNRFSQEVLFNTTYGRYLRLVATSEVNANPWAAIAELDVFHCVNYATSTIDFTEVSTQTNDGSSTDDCYEITRTWTATDYCNRTNTFTQVIVVEDNEGPELFNLPPDITIGGDTIPSPPAINCTDPDCIFANDNCDPDVTVVFSENNVPVGCDYNINRTWSVTDNCGNVTSHTQVISILSVMVLDPFVTSDFNGRDVSCFSASDGTAAINVSGGTPPYSVLWEDGQTGTAATGLTGSTYSITVTDDAGCTAVDSVTLIPPPPIDVSTIITSNYNGEDISCFGEDDGSTIATVSGGTGVLSILWSNDSTTASITNLVSGTYTVTVTDENGCSTISSVTLDDPTDLSLTVDVTSDYLGDDISCPGLSDGEATATAVGGTGAISYAWSNSVSTAVNGGLLSGAYYVTASDQNGCFVVDSVALTDPTPITLSIDTLGDPGLCGGNDGVIVVSGSGGSGSFEYRLGTTGTWQNNGTFSGLTSGAYDIFIRNIDGTCESTATGVVLDDPIPQACPISFELDSTVICSEDTYVLLTIPASADATGYNWTIPPGINVVSGSGTDSIVLDMNNVTNGFYDVCVITTSACGDSPPCCASFQVVDCPEICNDGIDNDGDGDIDSADDECISCDSIYTSNLEYIQKVNTSGIASDTINSTVLINQVDALGLDPVSERFYFLEQGTSTPQISYFDSPTGTQVNTGVTIPATAPVPALGFNVAGLGYALSENGELFSITTNEGGTDIPTVSLLGNIGAMTLGDLAVDNNGLIWVVANSNELLVVNPLGASPTVTNLGAITEVGNFGGNTIEAIAFQADGTLKVGAGSGLYDVDVTTVQATYVADMGVITEDMASCVFPVFDNDLSASKIVSPNTTANPGDTLTYTITVANNGASVITGVALTDSIPAGTAYLQNSTTLNGSLLADVAGVMPFVAGSEVHSNGWSPGILMPGQDAIVTFQVVLECCYGLSSISNQGVIDFNGATASVLSDDPSLPGTADPTVININSLAAPNISTSASNQTIDCDVANQTTLLNNWLNNQGGALASVDCGTVTWTNDFSGLTPSCGGGGSATVTFTATNECGLSNSTSAVFTITDTIPPTWVALPVDIDVECDGTADPRGEIAAWLASNGGATVTDACGSVTITNDYTIVPNNGCGNTGAVTVTFTATDECSRTSTRTAVLSIIDTTAPEISPVDDVTVDCDEPLVVPTPTVQDSCDADVGITYEEVAIYHPSNSWRTSGTCDILYTVSKVTYEDQGTTADTSDDEITFTIAVIGQNTGSTWNATINGTPVSGAYDTVLEFGPFLSGGTTLNFTIQDGTDPTCTRAVSIDSANY